MDHADHVDLLRKGVSSHDGRAVDEGARAASEIGSWADLGAGTGAFTLALAELLPAGSTIHAVDRDGGSLDELAARFAARRFSDRTRLETHVADFRHDLGLSGLDGVVMANSLHFVKDKAPVLARVRGMLRPEGTLLLVEYDADRGNTWVPYPLSFETWRGIAVASGFSEPRLLDAKKSRFLSRLYSAASAVATAR